MDLPEDKVVVGDVEFFFEKEYTDDEKRENKLLQHCVRICKLGSIDDFKEFCNENKYLDKSINIYKSYDVAFYHSCLNSNLEISKYLYDNYDIDLHIENDALFYALYNDLNYKSMDFLLDYCNIDKNEEIKNILNFNDYKSYFFTKQIRDRLNRNNQKINKNIS